MELDTNPLFNDPLIHPLTDPPFTRYVDAYSSDKLPPSSTTTQYFGVNPKHFVVVSSLEKKCLGYNEMNGVRNGASSIISPDITPLNFSQRSHWWLR
jgi:hypothetical protein